MEFSGLMQVQLVGQSIASPPIQSRAYSLPASLFAFPNCYHGVPASDLGQNHRRKHQRGGKDV